MIETPSDARKRVIANDELFLSMSRAHFKNQRLKTQNSPAIEQSASRRLVGRPIPDFKHDVFMARESKKQSTISN